MGREVRDVADAFKLLLIGLEGNLLIECKFPGIRIFRSRLLRVERFQQLRQGNDVSFDKDPRGQRRIAGRLSGAVAGKSRERSARFVIDSGCLSVISAPAK